MAGAAEYVQAAILQQGPARCKDALGQSMVSRNRCLCVLRGNLMYGSKIGTEMEAVQLPEVRILLQ